MNSSMMRAIFLISLIIYGTTGVQIECEFKIVSQSTFSDIYTCVVRDFNVTNDNEIVENVNEMHHSSGMANNDVKALIIEHQKAISMPIGIAEFFPNLEIIEILNSGLTRVHVDSFKGLSELRILDLSENHIEELEDEIFNENLKLEIISFKSNEIKAIGKNIFNHLASLQSVTFKNNDCVDDEWMENFEEMRKSLEESCSSVTIISSSDFTSETRDENTLISSSFSDDENDEQFNVTCNFIEKLWPFSEKDLFTCNINNAIENSNYFLSPSDVITIDNNAKVQAFEMSEKKSKFLPKNLNSLVNLLELSFENSQLQSISGMLFKDLKNLKRATFSGNEINVIEQFTFMGLASLVELDLSEGEIRYIEDGAFAGLESLLLLNLGANKLNHLNSHIFNELTQLQFLSLELNHLTIFNDENLFNRNSQLVNIWLNGNKISSFSSTLLSHLTNLRLVDLQGNECIDKIFNETNIAEIANVLDESSCSDDTESESVVIVKKIVKKKIKKIKSVTKYIEVDEEENEYAREDVVRDEFEVEVKSHSSDGGSLSKILGNVKNVIVPLIDDEKTFSMTEIPGISTTTLDPNLKTVKCQFDQVFWINSNKTLKTCIIHDQIIDSADFVVIHPEIIDDDDDEEVQGLIFIGNSKVKFFPSNLGEKFPNLLEISAKNSSISLIKEETFEGLKKLKTINLANNLIKSLIPGTFDDLRELEELDLSYNEMENVDELSFEKLGKLKVLRLNDNKIHYLHPKLLKSLRSLQNISISDNYLSILDDSVFKGNKNLKNIWANNNKLKRLSSKVFKNSKQLEFVDLRMNKCVDDFYNVTQLQAMNDAIFKKCGDEYTIEKRTLKSLMIKKPNFKCNKYEEIFWENLNENLLTCIVDDEETTTMTNNIDADNFEIILDQSNYDDDGETVKALSFNGNKNVRYLPVNIAKVFPNLQAISVENSRVHSINDEAFRNLTLLRYITMKGNKIDRVSASAFKDLKSLEGVEMDDNEIEEEIEESTFTVIKKLKKLKLSGNKMKSFNVQLIKEELDNSVEISIENNVEPTMEEDEIVYEVDEVYTLDPDMVIDNENYELKFTATAPDSNVRVKKFIVKGNENVKFLPKNLHKIFPYLEDISMTLTNLSHIDSIALSKLKKLKILNLSQNRIERISPEMFNGLEKLEVLNLSKNKIENIDADSFDYLESLNKLFLSDNKIHSLDKNLFTKLRNLNEVKLDKNLLTVVDLETFVSNLELMEIDLSRNYLYEIEPNDAFSHSHLKKLKAINLRENKCIDDEFVDMEKMLSTIGEKCLAKNRKIILNCKADDDDDSIDDSSMKRKSCKIDQEIDRDNFSDEIAFHMNGLDVDPTKIEHLIFNGIKVKNVSFPIGKLLPNLQSLSFIDTAIIDFNSNIFNDLKSLSELKISGHRITNISTENFISSSPMTNDDDDDDDDGKNKEKSLMKNLKVLILSNNNIKFIAENSFDEMENLEKLDLSNNKVEMIHENLFNKLRRLNDVKLDNNLLSIIEMKTFNNNPLLSEIDLSRNFIRTLSPSIFDKLKNIKKIKLKGNECIDEENDNENEIFDFIKVVIKEKCSSNLTQESSGLLTKNSIHVNCSESNYETKSCRIIHDGNEKDAEDDDDAEIVIVNSMLSNNDVRILNFEGRTSKNLLINFPVSFPNLVELSITLKDEEDEEDTNNGNPTITRMMKVIRKLPMLKILKLKGLKVLPGNLFDEMENLQVLEIEGDFEDVEKSTFQKLPKLKKLKINSDEIKTLDPHIFEDLSELEEFELQSDPNLQFSFHQMIEMNPKLKIFAVNRDENLIKSETTTVRPMEFSTKFSSPDDAGDRQKSRKDDGDGKRLTSKEEFKLKSTTRKPQMKTTRRRMMTTKKAENQISTTTFSTSTEPEESTINNSVKCYFEHAYWPKIRNPLITCSILNQAIQSPQMEIIKTSYDNYTKGLRIENNKDVKYFPENIGKSFPNLERFSLKNSSIESIFKEDFDGLSRLESLDLAGNKIESLEPESFASLSTLNELDVSDNEIEFIHENAFKNLTNLTKLDLRNNKITSIHPQTFRNLPRLKEVLIEGNQIPEREIQELYRKNPQIRRPFTPQESHQMDVIKGIGCVYGDNEWTYPNSNLFTCKIDNRNVIDDVNVKIINHPPPADGGGGRNRRQVEGLSILDNEKVHFLPINLSDSLPNLVIISASNNSIERISNANFGKLPSLKYLNLAKNKISSVGTDTFIGLENVEDVDLSENRIVELDESTFRNLPKLHSIYLGTNEIRKIPSNIFEYLSDLQNISLENNRLQTIDRDLFARNPKLKNIWLNSNNIQLIDPSAFPHSTLEYVDLRDNECISKFFYDNDLLSLRDNILHFCQNSLVARHPQQLKAISTTTSYIISKKKVSCNFRLANENERFYVCSINEQPVESSNVEISESDYDKYVEIINFDNNKNLHFLPRNIGRQFPTLSTLTAKNARLSSLNRADFSSDMKHLKMLDLSDNKIERIPSATFDQLPNLNELVLSSNKISQIGSNAFPESLTKIFLHYNKLHSIEPSTFNGAKHLKELHLQSNEIDEIPEGAFYNNQYLEEINLAGNKLKILHPNTFDKLLNLQLVDLEGNDCIDGTYNQHSLNSMKMKIRSNCNKEVEEETTTHGRHDYHVAPEKIDPFEIISDNSIKKGGVYSLPCMYSTTFSSTLDKFVSTCTISDPVYGSDAVVESMPNNRRVKRVALTNKETNFLPNEMGREFPELEEISATNLEIESISPENFSNFPNLKNVIMFGNNLKRVDPETFNNLPSLEILDLSGNRLKYFTEQAIDSLKHLNLEGNNLKILNLDSLSKLPQLQIFNANNNQIPLINDDTFTNNPRLKRISLNNNEIGRINPNAFSHLVELQSLDLTGNECINVSIENENFSHENLKSLLDRSCGSCENVRKTLNVCRRNLNSLRKLRKSTAAPPGHENGNDDDNINMKKLEDDFKKAKMRAESLTRHIQKLKTDYQREKALNRQYKHQLDMISNQNQNLQQKCMEKDADDDAYKNAKKNENVVEINCEFYESAAVGEGDGDGEYSCVAVDFTSLSDNSTLDDVKGNHNRGKRNSDVSSLTISRQNVKYLPKGVSKFLPNLKKVTIDNSNLRRIDVGDFEGDDDVVELIIRGNQINSIEPKSFDDVQKLEFLDLSYNQIQEIPSKIFAHLKHLKHLNMKNNALKSLNGDILPTLNNIHEFDVSNNKLKEIDPSLIKRLKNSQSIDFTANICINSKATNEKIKIMSEIIINCTKDDDEKFCKL